MKTMRLYRIYSDFEGPEVLETPKVPTNRARTEDETVERVCACPTIVGCLRAMPFPGYIGFSDDKYNALNKEYKSIRMHLYESYVDVNDIIQPTADQLPDAFFTGELWITKPCTFKYVHRLVTRIHVDIHGTVFSRYIVKVDNDEIDEVVDRITAIPIYGVEDSFSILCRNPEKVNIDDIIEDATTPKFKTVMIKGEKYKFLDMSSIYQQQ